MSIEDRGCISDYIDSGYRCLAVRFCLDGKKRIISFDSRIEGLSLVSRETANVQTVKFVYCTRRIFWIRSFEVRLFSSIYRCDDFVSHYFLRSGIWRFHLFAIEQQGHCSVRAAYVVGSVVEVFFTHLLKGD